MFGSDVCPECKSDLGETGFHGDGCSQNGRLKPWPLNEIREEPLKRAIIDKILAKRWRMKWAFGGGVGECYMSILKPMFGKPRFGVTVWREFDKWIGKEQSFKYRICFIELTSNEYLHRQGIVAGPLVFETVYRAGELFELIHKPRIAAIRKRHMLPKPPPKEPTLLENLKRILSSI